MRTNFVIQDHGAGSRSGDIEVDKVERAETEIGRE